MSRKRTINRGPFIKNANAIDAGNKFVAIKNKQGKTKFAPSVLAQRGQPSPKVSKHITRESISKPTNAAPKTSFKASAKPPTKENTRAKGLQRMKQKIANSNPSPTTKMKSRTIVKRKPPTKGR